MNTRCGASGEHPAVPPGPRGRPPAPAKPMGGGHFSGRGLSHRPTSCPTDLKITPESPCCPTSFRQVLRVPRPRGRSPVGSFWERLIPEKSGQPSGCRHTCSTGHETTLQGQNAPEGHHRSPPGLQHERRCEPLDNVYNQLRCFRSGATRHAAAVPWPPAPRPPTRHTSGRHPV